MVNYLLEHKSFPLLLDFLIGYSLSRGKTVDNVPSANGIAPIITDRDIFGAQITKLINSIATDSIGYFDNRQDYRATYQLYYALFFSNKFKESEYTFVDIKNEMEENGLIFNEKMFTETDNPRVRLLEGDDG